MGVAAQDRVPPGAGPVRVMDPGPALSPTAERDLLDVQRRGLTSGATFARLVDVMLDAVGACAIVSRVACGVPVCAQGNTRSGRPFVVLQAGSLSIGGRRGMSSADRFWVTLGKASTLRLLSPQPRTLIVVATTNAEPSSPALRKALSVLVGPGLPFDAVCDLTAEAGVRSWLGVLAE